MRNVIGYIITGIVKSLVYTLQYLPESVARVISRIFIRFLLLLKPSVIRTGRINLKLAFPEKTDEERERILKDSFNAFAENLLMFSRAPRFTGDYIEERYDMKHLVEVVNNAKAKSNGVGVMMATLHWGAFEGVATALKHYIGTFGILARTMGFKQLDHFVNTVRRERPGHEVFYRKGGYREMLRRLKRGQDLIVLIDQNVKRRYATFLDFFGIKTANTKAIAVAAIKTGAPIVFFGVTEVEPKKYVGHAKEIHNPYQEEGTLDEKVDRIMTEILEFKEELIKQYPEHWFWIHRRFKTRPVGDTTNYYA